MAERRRVVGQHFLGVVDFLAAKRLQALDFVQGQFGEEFQEPAHIGVFGVAPVLPVIISRQHVFIQPLGAYGGLAHLGPGTRGQQRRRQPVKFGVFNAAAQFNPADDVAPLVRAAHLQRATVPPGQFQKIIGLQDHVVEFQERQRLFALKTQFHRIEAQHPVDREIPPVIAQERYVGQIVQPIGVVDHQGVGRAPFLTVGGERQELGEHVLDAGHVGGDVGIVQELAGFVLARRIADFGGAAPHQHDGFVAGLLEQPEQHDRHQGARMQAGRRAIETDVGRDRALGGLGVQGVEVRALVQESAFLDALDKIRFMAGHDSPGLILG